MNQFLSQDSFFLIAGPCALESEENVMFLAENIKKIADKVGIKFCFKIFKHHMSLPMQLLPVLKGT